MTPTLSSAMPALETDRDIWAAIRAEGARQEQQLELIASENHASAEVIAAMGTVLTNKYAEGYPGKRYYGGCEHVDVVERIARERCQALFGAPYANVQPHSGTQATIGALMAVAQPGDEILAMSLDHGGHLSHGHPKNASGIFFHFAHYGLNPKTERIDMDQVREQALAMRPKVIVAGGSAYPRLIDFAAFAAISKEVGAKLLVDMAHIAGLVAGGVHANPVGHADVIASSTHKTLRGPRGGFILMSEGTNKSVNSAVFPGGQGGPLMHVIAAKAIAFREAQQDSFKVYARNVVQNAKALAETLVEQGLRLVSGGTDNHLMLVDVSSVGLTGDVAENLLHAVDITCNKNLIPFDQQPPMKTSGIRLGTPAVTTRGLNVDESRQLGRWIADVLRNPSDTALHQRVRGEVGSLCRRRKIYPA